MDAVREDLDAHKWREEDLLLMRVLREPREISAAIDHTHLHLEDDRCEVALRSRLRVVLGLLLRGRARREAVLDAAAC